MSTMMLISSDPSLVRSVGEVVRSIGGFVLEVFEDVDQVCLQVGREDVVIVLFHLDERSSVASVTRLLQTISIEKPSVITLVISDEHRSEQGLALLRLGVADYLSRPVDLDRLAYVIDILTLSARRGARRVGSSRAENPSLTSIAGPNGHVAGDTSSPIGKMIEQVRRIAPSDTTILLEGETGTGKTRLANVIHQLSPRRDRPFLVVNCGALSASLIESELFGHVRGAFTSADADRVGKFTEVGRGTLFLDEIDSLPIAFQSKLLRVVEDRVFEPVGSNRSQPMQARLIVASNRPLEQEVTAGRFRADLFYRLNIIAFELPPLRERVSSIPELVKEFVDAFAAKSGRCIGGVAPEALGPLLAHRWPGNIRELRNVIERAVVLCDGSIIRLSDLPESFHRLARTSTPAPADSRSGPVPSPGLNTLATSKAQAESGRITEALKRHGGNRLQAAAELGISRMTLYNKLHKYGLTGTL
jgi:DNA-binding NtrC family response regulator